MDDINVSDEIKTQLLEGKLKVWYNTYISAEIDAKVAKALGDEKMLGQAKDNMKRALQAAGILEQMLKELKTGGD